MVTLVNRAKMSTSTTGTGTITLGSAETGYQTFADAGVADGDVVRYVIEDGNNWEIGSGTYTATGTTLSRTVDESSNADAALNLTGSAVVFITAAAGDVFQGELFAENYDGSSTKPSATGTNGIALGRLAVASGNRSISVGGGATATGLFSTALTNSYASGGDAFAAAISTGSSSYGATGANSIAMGYQNKATGTYSIAIAGLTSTSSNSGSAIFGGFSNTSSGTYSTVLGGRDNTADAGYAYALGHGAHTQGVERRIAFAGNGGSGVAQSGIFCLSRETTDATATALTVDRNQTASTDNQIILPNNSAYSFSGTIIARESAAAGSDYASWEIKGALLRDANAASTVLGNGIVNKLYATSGASAWAVALTADTTNGGLKVEVTGAAATNIRWVATVNTSEVTYA